MTKAITPSRRSHMTAGDYVGAQDDPYMVRLALWLEGLRPNTRRSYERGIVDFMGFINKHPSKVTALDVAKWKEHLKRSGASDSTVAQRLSAVSSYYNKLTKANGDAPLQDYNPVHGVDRDDLEVSPYESSRPATVAQYQAIVAEIDTDTITGARDRALLDFYVINAGRRSEIVGLRKRDIHTGEKVTYQMRVKGGKVRKREIPPPVWQAMQHYLDMAGRPFDQLADDAPIFVATVDNGDYLRKHYGHEAPEGETPLTGVAVSQSLKRYVKRAGLDPSVLSLHSLRHLGGLLFYQASGDILATKNFMGHSQINTTQIYIDQMTGEDHRHWQAMQNMLSS